MFGPYLYKFLTPFAKFKTASVFLSTVKGPLTNGADSISTACMGLKTCGSVEEAATFCTAKRCVAKSGSVRFMVRTVLAKAGFAT